MFKAGQRVLHVDLLCVCPVSDKFLGWHTSADLAGVASAYVPTRALQNGGLVVTFHLKTLSTFGLADARSWIKRQMGLEVKRYVWSKLLHIRKLLKSNGVGAIMVNATIYHLEAKGVDLDGIGVVPHQRVSSIYQHICGEPRELRTCPAPVGGGQIECTENTGHTHHFCRAQYSRSWYGRPRGIHNMWEICSLNNCNERQRFDHNQVFAHQYLVPAYRWNRNKRQSVQSTGQERQRASKSLAVWQAARTRARVYEQQHWPVLGRAKRESYLFQKMCCLPRSLRTCSKCSFPA